MTFTKKPIIPNLLIAGAPKSGTSSLFFWLGAHPEVCYSKVKETYFLADQISHFNEKRNIHIHGQDAYSEFFKHYSQQKYVLEATPVYIYQKTPIDFFSKESIKPKVLFLLRSPAERLYSHWKFNKYRMKNMNLTFRQYLDPNNIPKGWQNYLDHTEYIKYIKNWINGIGKSNIMVFQFEAMKAKPKVFMKQLSEKLDIESSFYDNYDFFHRNQSLAISSKKIHNLGLRVEPYVPHWLQERLIPIYLKLNSNKLSGISMEELELKREVARKYHVSNLELQDHFPEIDLTLWD